MIFARYSIVSTIAMVSAISSAHAGFQFSAPPVQTQKVQQAPIISAPASVDTPMPIVPAPEVEAMALTGMPVSPVPQQQQPKLNGGLVINPYPLQESIATHMPDDAPSLNQAMIEGAPSLRPVVTPGSDNANGRIARATITSRFDGETKRPQQPSPQHFDYGSSLTPIPGGEGGNIEQQILSVQPAVEAQSLMPRPAPTLPVQNTQVHNDNFAEAIGFGRDLPLALALTQVVPADYSFSFSPDIDAGASVSWQGGKPWNIVLNEMLAAKGLTAVISGKQVTVQSAT